MTLYCTVTFGPSNPTHQSTIKNTMISDLFLPALGAPAVFRNASLSTNTNANHLNMNLGDSEPDTGVVGSASGDPSLDWSNECDCESGGV